MENLFRKNYISKNSLARLEKFQYSGSNISYLYNWVVSPLLENHIMKLIPLWLAPNLITIISFVFNFLALVFILLETKFSFEVRLSSFALFFKAFSHMMYIILDNADGKQARRTKNSSPLGLLLDHGFDAITTAIVGYNCSFIAMLGNHSISSYFLFLGLFWGYFMANYEEYKTGRMELGPINGPDEGNFVVFLVALLSFIFGLDYWHKEIMGFRLADILVFGVCFGSVQCTIDSIRNFTKGKNFFEEIKIFFQDGFWIMNNFALPLLTYLIDRDFYFENMIFFLSLMTVIFLRIGVEILINIVCKRQMRHNSFLNVIIGLWYVNLIARLIAFKSLSNAVFLNLYVMAILAFLELVKFLVSCTVEIRDHLGLSLLYIPYKKE